MTGKEFKTIAIIDLDMTQDQLAKKLNVTRQTIANCYQAEKVRNVYRLAILQLKRELTQC